LPTPDGKTQTFDSLETLTLAKLWTFIARLREVSIHRPPHIAQRNAETPSAC
jgi:hypothetical protein